METLLKSLHPREWFTGLWRHPDFPKLWGSLTIVHFGGQITFLALPLTAAIVLNASPFEVGVLTALEALPYPLFVKPANLGSSVGISKAHHRDELLPSIDLA